MAKKRPERTSDCPGMLHPEKCLECPYPDDCRLRDDFAVKGHISWDAERALAGSFDVDDRAKVGRCRDRYLAKRDKTIAQQKARKARCREALAESQGRIREARKRRGIQQGELARMLGVSQPTLSGWEHGAVPARWEKIYQIFPELKEETK